PPTRAIGRVGSVDPPHDEDAGCAPVTRTCAPPTHHQSLTHARRRIPMFVRFAILETPHIEPSRGVALRGILGVLQLVDIRDYHEIALGYHRHDLRLHLLRYRYRLHLPDLGQVLPHT